MVEVELKQWGNSVGAIIPPEELRVLGLQRGDKVDIDIVKKERIDGFGLCKKAKPFKEEEEVHKELW